MTVFCQGENTVVDRVQITVHSADLEEQQRIRQFLGRTSLRPGSLPASAILIVRRLRRALPHLATLRHKLYLPSEWEQETTEELDNLVSQAARPARAPVPPAAQAVLFLDRSEWLACLAHDWLQGALHSNWWWSALLKRGDAESVLFREWHQSPEFIPAALHRMAVRSDASNFLQCITDDQATIFLDSVVRAFAIPALIEIRGTRLPAIHANNQPISIEFTEPEARSFDAPRTQSSAVAFSSPDHLQHASRIVSFPGTAQVVEPWLPWVHEASIDDLSVVKRLLLAQALMVHRVPAMARSIAFQKQIAAWHEWAQNRIELHNSRTEPTVIGERKAAEAVTPKTTETTDRREALSPDIQPVDKDKKEICDPQIMLGLQKQDAPAAPEVPTQARTEDACAATAPATFESAFAGVCFLLNVALHLHLYADFTAPRTQGLELNIWDLLCLLGREFVGAEIENDPLFEALASLAGRTISESPGAYFDPPHEWVLPQGWLDAFPEIVETQEVIYGERRQPLHPAGFFLADSPIKGANEQEGFLTRWVGWVSSYIRARLVRALGRDDAAHLLCRIPGRLTCTATRVDVFYSLDSYPIEVRLAGLDRDPGWIPAAGRYVAYQFQ